MAGASDEKPGNQSGESSRSKDIIGVAVKEFVGNAHALTGFGNALFDGISRFFDGVFEYHILWCCVDLLQSRIPATIRPWGLLPMALPDPVVLFCRASLSINPLLPVELPGG